MKLFVGNLSFRSTEDDLRDLFAQHGEVSEAVIITDRQTGRSRGFGFVTMDDDSKANAAIEAINGTEFDGRSINVNEARPKTEGGGRRDGGGGGGRNRW